MSRPGRGDKTAQIKKKRFLKEYRQTGNVSTAMKSAKIARTTFYDWIKEPEFAEEVKAAEVEATENLEAEATRRAMTGVVEPVFYQGKAVGGIRRYSDTLLIFLLKARNPKKYRENVSISIEREMEEVLDRLKNSLPKEVYAQVLKSIADSEDRT